MPVPCAHSCRAVLASAARRPARPACARANGRRRRRAPRRSRRRERSRRSAPRTRRQARCRLAAPRCLRACRRTTIAAPRSSSTATSAQVSLRTRAASRGDNSPSLASGKRLQQHVGHDQPEHAVAEKLEPLVGLAGADAGVADRAGMGQRRRQQATVREAMADARASSVVKRIVAARAHSNLNIGPSGRVHGHFQKARAGLALVRPRRR